MPAKVICIWGKGGCGKTTLAINLSAWLANQHQKLVGLISAEDYAEIPTYLNLPNYPDKGLGAAKNNPTDHIKNYYIEGLKDSSLYILSAPREADSFDMCGFDKAFGRKVIQESREVFDVVVVDATTAKENAITGEGIAFSDNVIIPINDDVAYPEWFYSNRRIFENIKRKTICIESMYNGYANLQSIVRSMGVNPITSLQYIKNAPGILNEGGLIYKGGREQKIYESSLNAIWEAISNG